MARQDSSPGSYHAVDGIVGDVALAPEFVGSVLESLTCGLAVFDQRLKIVFRNFRARALLRDENSLPEALSGLLVDSQYIEWPTELRNVLQSGRSHHFDAKLPSRKDEPEIYLDVAISPLRETDQGKIIGGVLLLENVSSRISMERRLAVSERLAAVGQLAARVAHEVNNPLDGILRYVNLSMRRAGDFGDTTILEYLERVKSGIVRMGQIIASLLDFSRSTPNTFEQATIDKIIEDALASMELRAEEKKINVVCNLKRTDMPVASGSSLFQIFCNLIKNALDAMDDGGTLTISTDVINSEIVVAIEDTGVGLPEEMERIFEPFFTTKPPGKGTGLGLAVCKDLIERYGGTITPTRRQPNGTIMTVRVPQRSFAVPSAPEMPAKNTSISRMARSSKNRKASTPAPTGNTRPSPLSRDKRPRQ